MQFPSTFTATVLPSFFIWRCIRHKDRSQNGFIGLSRRLLDEEVGYKPRSFISTKILSSFIERICRRLTCNDTGISSLFNFWVLPNDLSELTLHDDKLTMVDASNINTDENRSSLKKPFSRVGWDRVGNRKLFFGSLGVELSPR